MRLLPLLLLVPVLCAAGPPDRAAPPLPGDRPLLSVGIGRQGLRLVDEVTSPVRWTGDSACWGAAAELPVGRTVLRARFRYARNSIRRDAATTIGPEDFTYRHVYATRGVELIDAALDARRAIRRGARWRLDLGAFLRWRVEAHGGVDDWDHSAGIGAVTLGPEVRLGWRPRPAWELAASLAVSAGGWVLRTPYVGYAYDWDWVEELRFRTLDMYVHVDAGLAVRRALGGRYAAEAVAGLEHTRSNINRPYRLATAHARLGLAAVF